MIDWLRNLRIGLNRSPEATPDTELLTRFSMTQDGDAFATLVARHGAMVFGVCRRVCGFGPDAEDAFQAAFVVLATKAAVIAQAGRVGAWLHGVAFHTARVARDRAARHRFHQADSLDQLPAQESTTDPDAVHIREMLDEVLAGLPEKYRAAVVLCHLEGLSRRDASMRLGWTEGTLSGRLARAMKLLSDRLSRRGLTAGVTGVAAMLSMRTSLAAVPGTLSASTVTAAVLVGSGNATLPPKLAALSHEVTRAMFPKRLKLFAAALLGVSFLAAGFDSSRAAMPGSTIRPVRPSVVLDLSPILVRDDAPKPAWRERAAFALPGAVTAVAFGPDLIVAGDTEGNVTLWDVQTGKEKRKILDPTLTQQKIRTDWLGFNSDATWVYLVNQDWSAVHGCCLDPNNPLFPGFGIGGSRHFGVSPDGTLLMLSEPNNNKTVTFFDNEFPDNRVSGKRVAKLEHPDEVVLVVVSSEGKTVATTTIDGTIRVWEYATQKEVWSAKPDKLDPTAVAVTADGKRVGVAGKDGTIRVFDETGKETAKLAGHTGTVTAVALSPDGKTLVSAGEDKTVRVWDAGTGKQTAVLKGHAAEVTAVAFSPDGKMVVSGSTDKAVKVWELK
jgi:RNA polymerase sigma factor (sigma-70 family)